MMRHLVSSTDRSRVFVYTASDERLLTFDCAGGVCAEGQARETWTLRDLSGQLLRVWDHTFGSQWFWAHDYIHGDGIPVAMANADGVFHLHPDHLGSTRQITNDNGVQVARHSYHPYSNEATDPAQTNVGLRFTGHERDPNEPGSGASPVGTGQLDSMHARYGSPVLGRFTSVDPLVGSPGAPQSWNRYAYVMGNPVNYIDPFGLRPNATFREEIYVYANAHSGPTTADRLNAASAAFYGSAAGAVGSGSSVLQYARSLRGIGSCSDFTCQVMGEVGKVAPQAAFLEHLVAEATIAGLTAGLGCGLIAKHIPLSTGTPKVNLVASRSTNIIDFLRPAGRLIGTAGSSSSVRILPGGRKASEALFTMLSRSGRVVEHSSFPGKMVKLPGGGLIRYRPVSTSGPATIDVSVKGLGIRKIKFID